MIVKKKLIFFTLILFGIYIRIFNINYDNLWFDEILSFWIADPILLFQESFNRHKSIEQIPFLYNFLLKIFFNFFGYDSLYGRYLSLILNVFGIIFATNICRMIKNNNSYLLALFLFSTNIFLINYSQELRPYSLVFFLCSAYLYLFYKIKNTQKDINYNLINFFLINISQVLMIMSHPFCLIIFFSTSLHLLNNYLKKNINSKILTYSFIFGSIFSILYIYFYLKNLNSFPSWIKQPDLKFYTNFYFSSFFGSRLMGLYHLIILLFLFIFFLKKNKKLKQNLEILFFIIFLSYFLPITYGYLNRPIIFPRYIIYILIPIIVAISVLIFEIKSKLIKNILIIITLLLNFGNHFSEATFRQFMEKRPFYKPNFESMIKIINDSNRKYYSIKMSIDTNKISIVNSAISSYIKNIKLNKSNSQFEYITIKNFNDSSLNDLWVICLPDVVKDRCINKDLNFKVLKEKNIPGIKMILISKI